MEDKIIITDSLGTKIEVTDLDKAITQCELCSESPFKMNEDGLTVGDYHKDLLIKLNNLKEERNHANTK